MADTLKTYTLECPDLDCQEEFEVQLTPEQLKDGGDPIECPACFNEWEWEYDDDTDTLELVGDEDYETEMDALALGDIEDLEEDDDDSPE